MTNILMTYFSILITNTKRNKSCDIMFNSYFIPNTAQRCKNNTNAKTTLKFMY